MEDRKTDKTPGEDQPPIFRRWRSWYWLLITVLVVLIIFFYLFTHTYA